VWVDTLRDMLDAKTDMYMALFEENDVNGKVLLNLDVHKLEKVGVKSLGHREQIVDAIVSLREAAGMPHGPRPGEFEAAMRAQNAPPRHPPKLVATEAAPAAAPVAAPAAHAPAANSTWVTADRVAWSQSGRTDIEYFLFLDGVGSVPKVSQRPPAPEGPAAPAQHLLTSPTEYLFSESAPCQQPPCAAAPYLLARRAPRRPARAAPRAILQPCALCRKTSPCPSASSRSRCVCAASTGPTSSTASRGLRCARRGPLERAGGG
jgi:hypothetical protein